MKILHIRFHNLNSLAGAWHIDFTDPAYTDHSLFAITGPTGAGKSTILDAVCLALYGRTPRLPRISKNSNEIMSRHTGFCSAEVEFTTVKGTFRCHWSQHRSRKKASGDLQPPKHEISDASADSILESKIKKVAVKVEEVTGMDFDRFTRSTLLAQGGFAAFLEASADNRAPLLEQITGTRIYSQLSIKVHELRGIEQKILADMQKDLEQTDLLSAEQEQEFTEAINNNEQQYHTLKQTLQKRTEQLHWLQNLRTLRKELQKNQEQLTELREEEKKQKGELNQLQPALEAEKISPLYQKLTALNSVQKETTAKLAELKKTLVRHLKEQETLQQKLQLASVQLTEAEKAQETGLLLIRQVEKIDQQKQNTEEQLAQHIDEHKILHKQQQTEKEELLLLEKQENTKKERQNQLALYFETNAADEHLSEELSALKIKIESLTTLQNREKESASAIEKAATTATAQKEQVVQLKNQTNILQVQTESVTKKHSTIQEQLSSLLQGKSSAAIRDELLQTTLSIQIYEELLSHLLEEQKLQKTTILQQSTLLGKEEEENHLQTELKQLNQAILAKAKEIELLEENLLLLIRIQNLEQDRQHLQEGKPCPLCGSLSHPYSDGETPVPSREEAKLAAAKKELKKKQDATLDLERKLSKCSENLKNLKTQLTDTRKQQTEQIKKAEELLSNLNLPPFADTDSADVRNKQVQLKKQQAALQKLNRQLDTLEKEEKATEKKLKDDTALLQENEKKLLTLTHLAAAAKQQEAQLKTNHRELLLETTKASGLLFAKLHDLHVEQPELADLPEIYRKLEESAEVWKANKKAETAATLALVTIASNLTNKNEAVDKTTLNLKEANKSCIERQLELKTLTQKRIELFADKDTEKEAGRLHKAVKHAQKEREQLQKQIAETHSNISSSRTLQSHLDQERHSRAKEIIEQEAIVDRAIHDSPFTDLEEFLLAKLDKERTETLIALQKQLQERRAKLTTLQQDKQKHIDREEEKKLCQEEEKELLQLIAENEDRLDELQKEIISRRELLNTNAKNKEKATLQLTKISRQKKITGSWNRLHSLIGSSDGKKFRNFAQGLTFEMMVSHANTTLAKISDRYILVRDKNQPLDLNVIDSFQGGEIRSTRNLSGGESFLVSLALALGLSRMASSNIRVDSLFLDEGFGTLDEDALESALETLSGLHEENKLIGIISHVAALKERIPVQIEVVPGQGGNNRIRGPGISQTE